MKLVLLLFTVIVYSDTLHGQDFSSIDFLRENEIEVIIPTFRGNERRNFYGNGRISKLSVQWKFYLGEGETVISRKLGSRKWKGAGWTGQPVLVKEGSDTFLIQGAYDHHLRKINLKNGEEIWAYKFDDVIKGTPTLWINPGASSPEYSILILQGSRLGTHHYLDAEYVPSYRAISYLSGKELWRMDMKFTRSYSRDVDGSALILNDTAYIGLENGIFCVFNPDPAHARLKDGMKQPEIYEEHKLYKKEDISLHGGNLVTESSPVRLLDHIYIASGSGHVFGYNLTKRGLDYDFPIGSDMDGSVVVTSDSCLLVSIEKQYIEGKGGLMKLDPIKNEVIWYQPVNDTSYAGWEGGVIGTAGINTSYIQSGRKEIVVVSALDGYTYVVDAMTVDKHKPVLGPRGIKTYFTPKLLAKLKTGPSISSPVITEDRIIICTYSGIFLYEYSYSGEINLLDRFPVPVEASPVISGNRLIIASRNGYLYCLGEIEKK